MIIIQVTNKILIVFSPKEILLDINTFSISTSFINQSNQHFPIDLCLIFANYANSTETISPLMFKIAISLRFIDIVNKS